MAFSLLSSGRSDMVSHAITLLKKRGINQPNKQVSHIATFKSCCQTYNSYRSIELMNLILYDTYFLHCRVCLL